MTTFEELLARAEQVKRIKSVTPRHDAKDHLAEDIDWEEEGVYGITLDQAEKIRKVLYSHL